MTKGDKIYNVVDNEEGTFWGIESTKPNVAWVQKKDRSIAIVNVNSIKELKEIRI